MNILHKVALQGLKKNRTRTAVTIIGVILSAAMITAVSTFGVSLLDYMAKGAAQRYGGWHLAFLDADPSFARERALDRDVLETVSLENIGYAALEGGKNPNRPYLFIAGFNAETFDALPLTLLSGRLPENSGEVLVSGNASTDGGVSCAPGDTLSLAVGSRVLDGAALGQGDPYEAGTETLQPRGEKTYTVVGICGTPAFEPDSAPGYTLITRTDAAEGADSSALFVKLKNPRRVHAYLRGAADGRPYILNHHVLRMLGLSNDPGDRIFNALLFSFGCIVVVIIMVGSIFLIYNAFSISLNERTRQIGILASVGATAKQLRNSVLFEGLCIGAVGIPAGVLVGLGGIGLVISSASRQFGDIFHTEIPLTMHVSALAIAGAAAVSLVTILISAYIPARRASNTPVMECIRQTNEVKMESRAVKTSRLAERVCGLEGTLALKNFKRNKKRYRSIVMSLILSVVLFISTSALVADLKRMSEDAKVVTDYDVGFGAQELDDGELLRLYDSLETAGGVTRSTCQSVVEYACTVPAGILSDDYREYAGVDPAGEPVKLPMELQFLDDDAYLEIIRGLGLPAEEYAGENARLIAVAKMQDRRAESLSQLRGLFAAPAADVTIIPLSGGTPKTELGREVSLTFVEFVPPDTPPVMGASPQQPYVFQVMAPWSLKEAFIPSGDPVDVRVKGLTFQSENPSRSAAEMKEIIRAEGLTVPYLLLNASEMLEENRSYIFVANMFAYTFIIMISLIAVANVFNTISTNIKLRRRELAMLRSVGMSDRDFNRMMRFECVFYGAKALLFGLPLAAVSSWLIHKVMVVDRVKFTLPWTSIGISVFSVLLVIFVTMAYAVGKIKKENIIDALRDDIT